MEDSGESEEPGLKQTKKEEARGGGGGDGGGLGDEEPPPAGEDPSEVEALTEGGAEQRVLLLEKREKEEEAEEKEEDEVISSPLLTSWRLKTIVLVTLAVVHLVTIRLELSMALVCMVKSTSPLAPSPLVTSSSKADLLPMTFNDTMGPLVDRDQGHRQMSSDSVLKDSTLDSRGTARNASAHACQGLVEDDAGQGTQKGSHEGEFEWSKLLQGHILSAFFYGLTVGQVVAGWCTDRWGGRRSLLVSVSVCSSLGYLLPLAARTSVSWFFGIRTVQGLFSGVIMAAPAYMCTRWGSPADQNSLLGLVFSGFPIGIAVNLVTSPFLCLAGPFGGWPSIFYLFSAAGTLWCVVAYFFVHDTPAQNPLVSLNELRYLTQGQKAWNSSPEGESSKARGPVPWRNLLTSVPILTTFWCGMCFTFGYSVFSITQPFFMRDLFLFPIDQNGLMSLLPWILDIPASIGIGMAVDFLKNRTKLSLTSVRKIFNTIGNTLVALVPLAVVMMDCNLRLVAATLLSLSELGHVFGFVGGYMYTPVDLAPPYSAMLIGWGNIFTGVNGFLAPIVVAHLTPTGSRKEWREVFLLMALLYALCALGFLLWGKAELEPWVIGSEEGCSSSQRQQVMLGKGDEEMGMADRNREIAEKTRLMTEEKTFLEEENLGEPEVRPAQCTDPTKALDMEGAQTPTAL